MPPPADANLAGLLYLNPGLAAHSNVATPEAALLAWDDLGLSNLPWAAPAAPPGWDARVYLAAQDDASALNALIGAAMVAEGLAPEALARRGAFVATLLAPFELAELAGTAARLRLAPVVSLSDRNLRAGDEVRLLVPPRGANLPGSRADALYGRVAAVDPGAGEVGVELPAPSLERLRAAGGAGTLFGIRVYDPERQALVALARNTAQPGGDATEADDRVLRRDFAMPMYHAVYPDTRAFTLPDTYLDYRLKWRRGQEYRVASGDDLFNRSAPYADAAGGGGGGVVGGGAGEGGGASAFGGMLTVTASNVGLGRGFLTVTPSNAAAGLPGGPRDTLVLSEGSVHACGGALGVTPGEVRLRAPRIAAACGLLTVAATPGEAAGLEASALAEAGAAARLAVAGDVFATGTVVTLSDARAKAGICRIDRALERVAGLRGYTFESRRGPGRRHAGLLAQDVLRALPEAVYPGVGGLHSVAYGNLVGLAVEAINELAARVDDLARQVRGLQASP
jgi:hypothetical protein